MCEEGQCCKDSPNVNEAWQQDLAAEEYRDAIYCSVCGSKLEDETKLPHVAGYDPHYGFAYYNWAKRCPKYKDTQYGITAHRSYYQRRAEENKEPF